MCVIILLLFFFFFKQKTAYEMRISDWSSDVCSSDLTMNFGEGDYIMTNTPAMLKAMARQVQALGVRPEIEAFDTGHLLLAKWLKDQGLIDDPVVIQLCMGIPWGAPDDMATPLAIKNGRAEWGEKVGQSW